ncbi:hypothetical protein B0H34DRAFT_676160 [Crassisporium funariophilum]|nr:hypothetical protein B0H34DRAFT_676160 [Crassisporium funariophilum]
MPGRKREATLACQANLEAARASVTVKQQRSQTLLAESESSDNDDNNNNMEESRDEQQAANNNEANASDIATGLQHTFCVKIDEGALATGLFIKPAFIEWSIVTDPTDIDGPANTQDDTALSNNEEPSGLEIEGDKGSDTIDNLYESGRAVEAKPSVQFPTIQTTPNATRPEPSSLKGYEYTEFIPIPTKRTLPGHIHMVPTQSEALQAAKNLTRILHSKRNTGPGYKDPDLDLWRRAHLEGMLSMLNMFMNPESRTYNECGASACQAAIGLGRGTHCARRLCELNQAFLANRDVLPINPYGDWNESLLVNENIVNELSIYLLSLGNEILAQKLMDYLHQPDVKEKYGIERDISHKTACRYLQALGYHYQSTPKGQYIDGHEREDVVAYREQVFLPKWKKFLNWMATWDKDLKETLPPGRRVIAWFRDESVFYAHNQRKKGWYHKDASTRPYAKGEGALLMIAHFVSADFGWLTSPDGSESAQRLFKPGKNRDGYFSNYNISKQATQVINILMKYYPEYDHVLIYDNATTHLKHADDALSARKMPKSIPKPGTNWGVDVAKRNPTTGKILRRPDEKTEILMRDGRLPNASNNT